MIRQSFLREIVACLLIALFTYTAIRKLQNPWPLAYVLRQVPLLEKHTGVLVWLIPCLELIAAALLTFSGQGRRAGYRLSFILMATFTIYVAAILVLSSNLPCSCGGIIGQLNWPGHLVLNLLLTCCSYWGWRTSFKNRTITRSSFQPA